MDRKEKILISAQMGCSTSSLVFRPFYKDLQKVFREFVTGFYFNTLEELSIILRVSGQLADFGGEGPERLEYSKKGDYITIDFVIPEYRWRDVDDTVIRQYIAKGMEQCFELLLESAVRAEEVLDEASLRRDFSRSMEKFRQM